MPPTRGHDLKHTYLQEEFGRLLDAPHTGARLETFDTDPHLHNFRMPPTRGHDLKPPCTVGHIVVARGCPPHGGTT